MTGETIAILCTILALVASGLATYYKGQAALSKELIREIRDGDEKVKAELRAEAADRRRELEDKLQALDDCYEDHEERLRALERHGPRGRPA